MAGGETYLIHRIWQQKGLRPAVLLRLRNSHKKADVMEYKFMLASERFEMELAGNSKQ